MIILSSRVKVYWIWILWIRLTFIMILTTAKTSFTTTTQMGVVRAAAAFRTWGRRQVCSNNRPIRCTFSTFVTYPTSATRTRIRTIHPRPKTSIMASIMSKNLDTTTVPSNRTNANNIPTVTFTTSTTASIAVNNSETRQQFSTTTTKQHPKLLSHVFVAVGSNLGNRFENIVTAIDMLCDSKCNNKNDTTALIRTSMLHETAPMYVTDQPSFLNGVIEIQTTLSPNDLLTKIKQVEAAVGRDLQNGIRYGPRPVDLDILFYYEPEKLTTTIDDDNDTDVNVKSKSGYTNLVMETSKLIIPHPRMAEREFVLAPLREVVSLHILDNDNSLHEEVLVHPIHGQSIDEMFTSLMQEQENGQDQSEETTSPRVLVIPLPRDRMLYLNTTVVMGILNVTPDSFSDGGKWNTSHNIAVTRALEMEQEGATIIDIGGESTRPGAKEIQIQDELERTIPVIEQIRDKSDIPISIDTRHSIVAKAAIEAGADIVNDVSGGTFDPDMLSTVAELHVPIVLMHMKGIPETMQSYVGDYDDVVVDVGKALQERSKAAELAGIPKWMQIFDPGIGFAKDLNGNLSLLKHYGSLRSMLGPTSSVPMLLGTSRKGFLGKLTGVENPEERDCGTVASCVAAICLSDNNNSNNNFQEATCNILRVHNVKAVKEACLVMDAIRQAK